MMRPSVLVTDTWQRGAGWIQFAEKRITSLDRYLYVQTYCESVVIVLDFYTVAQQ